MTCRSSQSWWLCPPFWSSSSSSSSSTCSGWWSAADVAHRLETCGEGLRCSCCHGNGWLAFSCETKAICFCLCVCVCHKDAHISLCINMHFDLWWLTGLKSTSRQGAIRTPSDWPMVDQMIQVKLPHMHPCLCLCMCMCICLCLCALSVSADVTEHSLSRIHLFVLGHISKYLQPTWPNLWLLVVSDNTWLNSLPWLITLHWLTIGRGLLFAVIT